MLPGPGNNNAVLVQHKTVVPGTCWGIYTLRHLLLCLLQAECDPLGAPLGANTLLLVKLINFLACGEASAQLQPYLKQVTTSS